MTTINVSRAIDHERRRFLVSAAAAVVPASFGFAH
jgi:hypothetical protein